MKHDLQSLEWSLGRRIKARFTLHKAQGEGGMAGVVGGARWAGGGKLIDADMRVISGSVTSHALW